MEVTAQAILNLNANIVVFSGVISSKRVSEATKDLACASYQEKSSLRGVARSFDVSH